jgi:hypothetical protein
VHFVDLFFFNIDSFISRLYSILDLIMHMYIMQSPGGNVEMCVNIQ